MGHFACADTDANAKSWRSTTAYGNAAHPVSHYKKLRLWRRCFSVAHCTCHSPQQSSEADPVIYVRTHLVPRQDLPRQGRNGSTVEPECYQCLNRNMAVSGCPPACAHLGNPDCGIYRGTLDGMRKIARREGFAALWRGVDVAFLMAIPTVSTSNLFQALASQCHPMLLCKCHGNLDTCPV